MAPEHMSAEAMTSRRGCGVGAMRSPTVWTIGRMTIAPTVCDTNVVQTRTSAQNVAAMPQSDRWAVPSEIAVAMSVKRPDPLTAAPSTRPPCEGSCQ